MENTFMYSGDKPLISPKEDLLGYASFAEMLASAIQKTTPTDGLVMSINGDWGSGKTTVINFIKYYLEKSTNAPAIVFFNPWWFSGREDLLRRLINQINTRLGGKDYERIKKDLSTLADVIGEIHEIPGSSVLKGILKKSSQPKAIEDLKESINKTLKQKGTKILVVIDDIDRLSPDEIIDLFRIIKASANFSNIIYLLAFDMKVVLNALNQQFHNNGKSYLEKIVQISFQLPQPEKIVLHNLFHTKFGDLIKDTPDNLFNQEDWWSIFYNTLEQFIKTPRSINILLNQLYALYPALEGEVNTVDYVALEALRAFTPEFYRELAINKDAICGIPVYVRDAHENEALIRKVQAWLELVQIEHREAVKKIVIAIFPQISSCFNGPMYSTDTIALFRRNLRACTFDYFDNYFRFTISPDTITLNEIKLAIAKMENKQEFSDLLIDYSKNIRRDGNSRLQALLFHLNDYLEDIPTEYVRSVINSLFDISDYLVQNARQTNNSAETLESSFHHFSSSLIKKVDNMIEQFEILKSATSQGKSLITPIWLFQRYKEKALLEQQKKDIKSDLPTQVSELNLLLLQKIHESAKNSSLQESPDLHLVLSFWKDNNLLDVKKWVNSYISEDTNLIAFMESSAGSMMSHIIGTYRKSIVIDLKWFKHFVDLDKLNDRIEKILESPTTNRVTDHQHEVLSKFVSEYYSKKESENTDKSELSI